MGQDRYIGLGQVKKDRSRRVRMGQDRYNGLGQVKTGQAKKGQNRSVTAITTR